MLISVRAPTPAEKSQNLARKIVTFALYMCSHFSLFSILYLCTRTRECGCVCALNTRNTSPSIKQMFEVLSCFLKEAMNKQFKYS